MRKLGYLYIWKVETKKHSPITPFYRVKAKLVSDIYKLAVTLPKMNVKTSISAILIILSVSCNQKTNENLSKAKSEKLIVSKLDERYSIVGDFNGDKIDDTIFESYQNSETKKEINKIHDSLDWDNDLELTVKNKPISILYSNDKSIDKLITSNHSQQKGVYLFSNLGDINEDGKDEFGYAIDWADFSSSNTYHIMTLDKNKFVEIFSFPIHETMSIIPENQFDSEKLILKVSKKTIKYKFADMEDGDIKESEHTFK